MASEPNPYQGRCAICGAYVMARKGFWDGSRTLCEEHARSGPVAMPEARVQICLQDGEAVPLTVSHLGREGYQRFASACAAVGVHFRHGRRTTNLDTVPRLMASLERAGFVVEVMPELAVALHARAVDVRRSVEEASKRADRADRKLRERGKALYEFQYKGVDRLAQSRSLVLGDSPGLGKTIQALVATPPEGRLLVIAPAIMKGAIIDGAPRGGWAQATRTWRPEFAVTILSGRASFRWPREGEVVITNYDIMPPTHEQVAMAVEKKRKAAKKSGEAFDEAEAMRQVVESMGAPAEPPDGQVVVAADEAHMCTKPDSLRTQRYRRLSRLALEAGGWSWALTGTPLMNKPEELWCLLDCLGVAASTFGSWANYMRLYDATRAQVAERRWEIIWGPPSPEVAERLRAAMLRREKRDVLKDLPERQTQTIVVPVDKSTIRLCDEALKALEEAGIDIEKALELADSAKDKIAFPIMSKVRMALAQAKAPSMIELAEQYESAETPVLFLSVHLVVPELMQRRKGWGTIVGDGGTVCVDGKSVEKVPKSEVVLRLLKGEISNVAGTIGAMGTGVDGLQERISHGIFVDEAWTPGANEQAVSRLERIGAQNRIMITRVIADHPLDYRVAEVIARKERLFDETIVKAADRPWDPVPEFDLAAELDKAASRVPPPWGTAGAGRRR